MNIAPISFRIYSNQYQSNTDYAPARNIKPNYNNQLNKDTVTFTHKIIEDTVWHNFVQEVPRLKRIATTYLNATEAIANKLKEDGIYFVREMFEETAVKEPDSKLSKVSRSKTFEVRDAIRTTLFSKNPYDLTVLFEKIIPEYGKSGYQIANIPTSIGNLMERGYVPVDEERLIGKFFEIEHTKESHNKYFRELKKLGYDYDDTKKFLATYYKEGRTPNKEEFIEIVKSLKKEMPDIDVRLKKKRINMDGLPDEYKYFIGKPQKSGYEDIQIRFIRDIDKENPKPVYHELLIQFGPTYNRNAYKEHKMVYEPLRLFDELHIPVDTPVKGEVNFKDYPEKGVEKFISDIKDMFRSGVSKKLINNGKNEDFFRNTEDNEEIFFTDKDIEKFERRFKNIKGFLREYYNQETDRARISSLATDQIEKDFKDDLKKINKIQKELKKTIDTVNHEYGLKDNG